MGGRNTVWAFNSSTHCKCKKVNGVNNFWAIETSFTNYEPEPINKGPNATYLKWFQIICLTSYKLLPGLRENDTLPLCTLLKLIVLLKWSWQLVSRSVEGSSDFINVRSQMRV